MTTPKTKPPVIEKLSPTTLMNWRERMGYTQVLAAKELGCSRTAWIGWEDGTHKIPRYIGLAMKALAIGMTPYGEKEHEFDLSELEG